MSEPERAAAASRLTRWRLALLVAIPAVALIAVLAGVADYASLEALDRNRAMLQGFVGRHPVLAPVAFGGVYLAGVALSIPGWGLLTVVGGFLFGPVVGTVIVVIAATAGGTLVFLVARYAAGDVFRARAAPVVRKLQAGFNENAISYLLALRLVPVPPFFATTLAVAFLGIPLRAFVIATFLGVIPATIVYATLGAGLSDALAAGIEDPLAAARQPTVIAGLAGLAVLALLPVAVGRLRRPSDRPRDE